MIFFRFVKSLFCVLQNNTELQQYSLFIYKKIKMYFQLLHSELNLGVLYSISYLISNDTRIIVFGSKLTKQLGVTI